MNATNAEFSFFAGEKSDTRQASLPHLLILKGLETRSPSIHNLTNKENQFNQCHKMV